MAEYNLNINFYTDTYCAFSSVEKVYIHISYMQIEYLHAHSSYVYICTLCIYTGLAHTLRIAFAKFMQNDAAIFVSDRCFGLCTRKEAQNVSRNRVSIVPALPSLYNNNNNNHSIALRIFIVQPRSTKMFCVCFDSVILMWRESV